MIAFVIATASWSWLPSSPAESVARLGHADARVRLAACRELEAMGPAAKSAVTALIARFDDPDLGVRVAAIDAVAAVGHAAVWDLLHADKFAEDFGDNAIIYLSGGLAPVQRSWNEGNGIILPLTGIAHWPGMRPKSVLRIALERTGPKTGEAILQVLQSARASKAARNRAMFEMSCRGFRDPDLVPVLIDLLDHKDKDTAFAAAGALAELGSDIGDGLPALFRYMNANPGAIQTLTLTFAYRANEKGLAADATVKLARAAQAVTGASTVSERIAFAFASGRPRPLHRGLVPYLVPLLDSADSDEVARLLLDEPGQAGRTAREKLLDAIERTSEDNQIDIPADWGVRWLRQGERRLCDAVMKDRVCFKEWTSAAVDELGAVLAGDDAEARLRAMTLIDRQRAEAFRLEPALRRALTGTDKRLHALAAEALLRLDVVDDNLREKMIEQIVRQQNSRARFESRYAVLEWSPRLAAVFVSQLEQGGHRDRELLFLSTLGPALIPFLPRLTTLAAEVEDPEALDRILHQAATESNEDRCKRLRSQAHVLMRDDPDRAARLVCTLPIRAREFTVELRTARTARHLLPDERHPLTAFGIDGALAALGSPDAISALIERIKDESRPVEDRRASAAALGHLGIAGRPGAEAVQASMRDRPRSAVSILTAIGAEIPEEVLTRAAEDHAGTWRWVPPRGDGFAPPARPRLLQVFPRWDDSVIDSVLGDRGPAATAALVPVLRESFRDESADARLGSLLAVNRLAWGTEALMPELIGCLGSSDPELEEGALYALARIGPAAEPALPRLKQLLQLGHAPIPIATALGRIRSPEAIRLLRGMLDDAEGHVRRAACLGLWHAGPRAAQAVGTLLCDEDLGSAEAALRVAPGRSAHRVLPLLRKVAGRAKWWESSTNAVALMGECGPAAVPALVEILNRGDLDAMPHRDAIFERWNRRRAVLKALGAMGPAASAALPALRAFRSNYRELMDLREAAIARITGRLGSCAERFRFAIDRPSRAVLLEAICECGDPAGIADLSWHADPQVRLRTVQTMGGMPGAIAITGRHLVARLDDTDADVRFAAAHALHRLGPAARPAAAALRELAEAPDPILRRAIREVLEAIHREGVRSNS